MNDEQESQSEPPLTALWELSQGLWQSEGYQEDCDLHCLGLKVCTKGESVFHPEGLKVCAKG